MNRLLEFFEDEDQRLSMSRALMFLAFWPGAWITLTLKTETALSIFLGSFVTGYVFSKGIDSRKKPNAPE